MKNKTTEGLSTKLAVLSVSLMLTSYGVISGVLPQIREALNVTETAAELLVTTPSLTALITLLISPALARFFGLKKVIAVGVLLLGVSSLVPLFSNDYTVIMASRIVFGLGLGCYNSLAITLIQILYRGNTRSMMLGVRGATENIGQAVMMAMVSVLFATLGWHGAFGVYLIAFPILIWFWCRVPEVDLKQHEHLSKGEQQTTEVEARHTSIPVMILFCLFAISYLVVLQSNNVRWTALAQQVMGSNFDASLYLSVGTVLGILSGLGYGFLMRYLGNGTFYFGVGVFVLASLMIGFGSGNFVVLVIANFLFNIPGAILGPFLFDKLPHFATRQAQAFWSSMIIVSFHIGVFVSPLAMTGIERMLGTTNLSAAFPIYALALAAIMLAAFIFTTAFKKKNAR